MLKTRILFKKTINLSMTLGLLALTVLPPISMVQETPVTAETLPNTLKPGETIDTNPQTLSTADFQDKNSYTPVGKNTVNAGWATGTAWIDQNA